MISKKSYLLMTLLVFQQVSPNFSFQSISHNKSSQIHSRHPSALPSTVSIKPRHETVHPSKKRAPPTSQHSSKFPQGQEWIKKSIEYYTIVMRNNGASPSTSSKDEQSRLAKRLYHAIQQVRSGNLSRAENIYRKTIDDIRNEGNCANAELATTTLLLALVLQRMDNIGEARMVFHRFFLQAVDHIQKYPVHECACTARVLGAYALFEMRFGSVHRSIEIARRAKQFDNGLSVLFTWKQFRDAKKKKKGHRHKWTPCSLVTEVNYPPIEDADNGGFRLRTYQVAGEISKKHSKVTGSDPSIIYHMHRPPLGANGRGLNDVPIRVHVHSSCIKSEIFRSKR
mmetsp:Transcript_13859/g.23650  ORF Transcript_13859/g.23650 Transcript_13859/m.23650 type:complete len:340 (-) Transcript_13859:487-1506(-)